VTTLAGKVVLVTGAGGGFGQEMTRQFLRAGSHMILSDLRTEGLPCTAAEVPGARGRIVGHIAADLSDPAGGDAVFEGAAALVPSVDILVLNAGIAVSGRIVDVPRDEWERLLAVDLLAPMRLTASFLPAMLERRRGHLVYVSSVAGLIGVPHLSAYSAAKFGLRGFAEAIAAEVKSHGLAVTVLYPYFARTPILDSPHYGGTRPALDAGFVYEPEVVIAALVAGVRQRKLHVYPGAIPRVIDGVRRLAPWALPLVLRAAARAGSHNS
jgi:NAD(P)-dependent dehydrogenase (short-subunit alcohol dehydrogenase family)